MSDFLENDNQPKEAEICVVKSPGRFGYQSIYDRKEAESEHSDMTRISEFVKVTFVPRKPDDVIPEMVAKIDKEIQQCRVDHEERLQTYYRQRQDLLALTYESSTVQPPIPEDDIPI
jgi:hypothetical protein